MANGEDSEIRRTLTPWETTGCTSLQSTTPSRPRSSLSTLARDQDIGAAKADGKFVAVDRMAEFVDPNEPRS